jgi:hypothetical protein
VAVESHSTFPESIEAKMIGKVKSWNGRVGVLVDEEGTKYPVTLAEVYGQTPLAPGTHVTFKVRKVNFATEVRVSGISPRGANLQESIAAEYARMGAALGAKQE